MTKKLFLCTVLFYISLLAVSCSGADPVIYTFNWALQALREPTQTNTNPEKLLIQVLADDDDGFEEIYELYIINDEAGLYWRITSDEWTIFSIDNRDWIGINTFYNHDYRSLPRGKYRLLIRDLSGYEDEKTFVVQEESTKYNDIELPKIVLSTQDSITPTFTPSAIVSGENNEVNRTALLQLTYPNVKLDIAGNKLEEEYERIKQEVGRNGALFIIENFNPIRFRADFPVYFNTYIHYKKSDNFILSSGPYEISLNQNQ